MTSQLFSNACEARNNGRLLACPFAKLPVATLRANLSVESVKWMLNGEVDRP